MKKRQIIFIGLGLVILLTGLAFVYHDQANQWRTLASLQKVDDYPLYVMTYYGDYGFKDFLQPDTNKNAQASVFPQLLGEGWACSVFATLNERGNPVLGRNFDWRNRATLLLYTHPPDGYASVSLVDVAYLGFNKKDPSWHDRKGLLEAPYWPFDGMNEAGLAVGMMAVPYAKASDDPKKTTIDSLAAIRLLLDYAKDVDEAVALLQNYNIEFGGGPPLHYLIADANRHSVIIEFIDGEMIVLRPATSWQVSTNFIISREQPEGAGSSCWRYNRLYEGLEEAEGRVSGMEAMSLLEDVSQGSTMWSVVYGLTTGDVQVAMGRRYDEVSVFRLEMQSW